jgi:hypothetical protein
MEMKDSAMMSEVDILIQPLAVLAVVVANHLVDTVVAFVETARAVNVACVDRARVRDSSWLALALAGVYRTLPAAHLVSV